MIFMLIAIYHRVGPSTDLVALILVSHSEDELRALSDFPWTRGPIMCMVSIILHCVVCRTHTGQIPGLKYKFMYC